MWKRTMLNTWLLLIHNPILTYIHVTLWVDAVIILIQQLKKSRSNEVKEFAEGHTTSKLSQNLWPGIPPSRPMLLLSVS